jgi:hypothetical protein
MHDEQGDAPAHEDAWSTHLRNLEEQLDSFVSVIRAEIEQLKLLTEKSAAPEAAHESASAPGADAESPSAAAGDPAAAVRDLKTRVAQLSQRLAERSAREVRARTEIADLRENISELGRKLEETTRHQREVKTELDQVTRERDELRGALRKAQSGGPVSTRSGRPPARSPSEPEALPPEDLELQTFDSSGRRMRMGEILYEAGIITQEQLRNALAEQDESPSRRLGTILIDKNYTGEQVIAQVLAAQLDMPYVSVSHEQLDERAIHLVPAKLAQMHRCVPVRDYENQLVLAMANPLDLIAIDDVEHACGRRVIPVVATRTEIDEAIGQHYSL